MTFIAAARQILREARMPMTTKHLATQALGRGLVSSSGRTPDKTMAAQLYTYLLQHPTADIRKLSVKGRGRAIRGSVLWEYVEPQPDKNTHKP
jgi:hypothetical protein